MRWRLGLASGLALLGLLGGAGCAREPARPRHIVVIVMDTTAASHLSVLGYPRPTSPNLERFAAEGAVFRQAFSTAPWTLPSHASLFTGLYPTQHGASYEHPNLDDGFVTLAEILARAGFRTLGYSNNAWVGKNSGLHRGFERFIKVMAWKQNEPEYSLQTSVRTPSGYEHSYDTLPKPEGMVDSGASVTNAMLRRDLEGHDFERQPLFLFVNYIEPHLQYRPPEEFARRMFPDDETRCAAERVRQDVHGHETGLSPMTEEHLSLLRGLYDGEVAYLDHRVGEVIRMLRDLEILDETLVVVTADHGEQIGDHGFLGHNLNVYDDLLHVPLLVRFPGLFDPGSVIEQPVQITDVFTSIVSLVDPGALEDLPLTGPHPLPTVDSGPFSERHIVAEYDRPSVRLEAFRSRWPEHDFSRFDRTLATLRFGEWKLIVGSDGARELYNIADDPGETIDLAGQRADLAERMSSRLADWLGSLPAAGGSGADGEELEPMDEETERTLRSLGYVN